MRLKKFLKPSRRKIVVLVVLALLGIGIFNQIARSRQAPLQTADVKKEDIKAVVSSSGTLTGKNTVNLKFKTGGKLAYINVKVGDKVWAGEAIAGLDATDLSIALGQAENNLRDKQAIVEKIEDDLKGHDKDETFAQKVTRTTAQVARDNAYDQVTQAKHALSDITIISPIGGVVTQAIDVSGQNVSGADTIAQVVDTTKTFFDTDIDEADISKVKTGQVVEVTLDAYPDKTFKGVVNQIIPQIKTTNSGATVVTVRISIDLIGVTFINGLSGQASIITSEAKDVLTIPQEALREDSTVVLQTQNGTRPKKVMTGLSSDTSIEIKEGLIEGEKVVLNPKSPIGAGFRLFGGRGR